MDAGQGDATLIVYPDGSLVLVDCGCKKNKNIITTEIENVLNAYLATTSNELKALVLTHPDEDHYNLVDELIVQKNVTVKNLFYGGSPSHYGKIKNWIENSGSGQIHSVINLGQGYFNVNPIPQLTYVGSNARYNVYGRILAANVSDPKIKTEANANSIVLLLTYTDLNMFLMGDATVQTEDFILGWNASNDELTKLLTDRHTMLRAGHHGSNTSTGEDWVKKLNPQVVFISSDTREFNGVSIPRSSVIDRLFANNTLVDIYPQKPTDGDHHYVQYNDRTDVHELIASTKAMCTTLHFLNFTAPTQFTAYGTGWYYQIKVAAGRWSVFINPACGWSLINTAY
jgi:beta-lactamase superfamily II metal-dependent hydrolase